MEPERGGSGSCSGSGIESGSGRRIDRDGAAEAAVGEGGATAAISPQRSGVHDSFAIAAILPALITRALPPAESGWYTGAATAGIG